MVCISTTLLLIVVQPWTVIFGVVIIAFELHTYISHVRSSSRVRDSVSHQLPLLLQLLSARMRSYPFSILEDSWLPALRGVVLVSCFLLTLVIARNELSALDITWERKPIDPASFLLGVLVLPFAFYAFRSAIIGSVHFFGLERFVSALPSRRDQLWGIRTQFSFLVEELFEKANRVQMNVMTRMPSLASSSTTLREVLSSANYILGPSLPRGKVGS